AYGTDKYCKLPEIDRIGGRLPTSAIDSLIMSLAPGVGKLEAIVDNLATIWGAYGRDFGIAGTFAE
ncbi:MAG: hypothetical protein DRR42_26715, partial [Gammaproteobacteria bacterium]